MNFGFKSFARLVSDPLIDDFEHSKDVCVLTFDFGAVDVNSFNFQKSYYFVPIRQCFGHFDHVMKKEESLRFVSQMCFIIILKSANVK